jgi:hypothetical protein
VIAGAGELVLARLEAEVAGISSVSMLEVFATIVVDYLLRGPRRNSDAVDKRVGEFYIASNEAWK